MQFFRDVTVGPEARAGVESLMGGAEDWPAQPLQLPASEFATVLAQGFSGLRFPAKLEGRYQQGRAAERLRLLRGGAFWVLLLWNSLLLTDWLMVRDQFSNALQLRLLFYSPLCLLWLLGIKHLSSNAREWVAAGMGPVGAIGTIFLSLNSHDELAPPYLVVLCMVQLINGGMLQLRFWKAVLVDVVILMMYAWAALALPNPPMEVVIAMTLVMVSVTVFTLYGSYWLEHEDRTNWLMLEHERGLQSQLVQANQQLERLSRVDPLTALANRRHFDEFLQHTWARASHDGDDVALLMIDVDHFKAYNDQHGHPAGDACLQAVAETLRDCLRRPEDLVARYGGEEFIALLSHSDLAVAMAAAERVRAAVDADGTTPVTVSIGVASVRPGAAAITPTRLMVAADQALYQAKGAGRNTVRAADVQPTLDLAGGVPDALAPGPMEVDPPSAAHNEVALAQSRIDRSCSWMRFPAILEQQFLNDVAPARLRYLVLSGILSLIVFNGFLGVDYLMARDVFDLAVKIRLGLFTPMAVGLLLLGWFGRDWVLRTVPPLGVECLVLVSGVFAAACLAYILAATHSPTGQYYHVGLMVVIIYTNIVQRLRFWYALACSVAILAMHIGGVLMVPAFNDRLILPVIFLVGATVVFTLMANYAMERDERKRYLLSLRQKQLLQELDEVHQRLQNLARVDVLTGAYNRRHLQEYLRQIWQRAQHGQGEVAVIMLDVDHFKKFNDRYGHPAGDLCLVQVAEVMRACLRRPGDLVARYGGEEFIAVLPQTGAELARQAAERIRLAVQALQVRHESSDTAAMVTVSVGVASARAGVGQTESGLIAAADAALYQAKHGGRNRVALATSSLR
ncbi:diguanylate cyclase [Aquabacterium sp.]|uniref:GGDEF domain-containing protein n=1 Tax=Aquabacterium sp. TaxID=1872578 RepID=UPI00198AAD2B|nr:diguanylate cyclase [Aquabacterium sp.]MBC7700237.1 diguanylate cyclase [Aquabacterium sp.]